MSIHRAHVFASELTDAELEFMLKAQNDSKVFGVGEDTERTCILQEIQTKTKTKTKTKLIDFYLIQDISVTTVGEILSGNLVDWSNVGMILSVVTKYFN